MLVVKIGGGAAIGTEAFANFAADIATLDEPVIIIHGGNAEFSALSDALGMPPRMITSSSGRISRYVDAPTMDAMLMAYCGKQNKRLVAAFRHAGVNAVGLSAMDGGIAVGRRKPVIRGTDDEGRTRIFRDDHAGTVETIDPTLITTLMNAGFVVLLTPPALAEEGVPINVDGDKLALGIAEALGAESLLFFSDTPGLLADRYDESTLIRSLDAAEPEQALAAAAGRMVVKVESAIKAIERGVGKVIFSDGRVERPVTRALSGEGTVISNIGETRA
ncbi:MAG TPA: [LysW]-aminoadipate kinase [Thermomicrobiales bacterium]|nr:[LysW]-aminoadipate kinase [Thermomicrobiales bacterium]